MSDTKPSTPEYRAISSLHNWENNPRTATKDGIERLIKQIKKLGVYKPLLITEDGTVLGGNMRLKALEQMGEKKVWVSVVQADTEEKKIEYALSDNDRVGKYEGDQLANLIGNFPEVEWGDYSVDIKEPELVSDLMDSFKEVEEDEAPAVEMGPAESKLGEVYQLGRHRVMCGDSTDKANVELLMNGQIADMVFTDPPYGIDLDTDYSGISKNWKGQAPMAASKKHSRVMNDDKDYDPTHIFTDFSYVKDIFLWGANYYSKLLPDLGSWVIWDKTAGHSQQVVGNEFEMLWSKQKHRQIIMSVKWSGIMGLQSQDLKSRVHPTQKPLEVHLPIINTYTEKGAVIIDLFLGSGSTLIACEQTDRTCYGMELDPHYVDVIRKRYDNFINRKITAKT